MCKVKTKSVRCYQRTFLFYMRAKDSFERFLEKMCCAVVFLCITTSLLIDFKGNGFSCGEHSGFHISDMTEFAAAKFDCIFYYKFAVCSFNHTTVTFLTAHGSIEWCFFYKYSSLLTFHQ